MKDAEEKQREREQMDDSDTLVPDIIEEIEIEDLTVDGICGVY